jgi:hypothetical protein
MINLVNEAIDTHIGDLQEDIYLTDHRTMFAAFAQVLTKMEATLS